MSGNYFLKMELSTGEKLSYPCKKDCYQKPFLIQISSKTGHVVLASTIKDQSLAIGQIRFFGEDKLIAVFTGFSKYNPNYWEPPKDSAGIGILNLFGQTEKVYSLKYNALTTISFSSNLTIDPMGFLLFSGNNFLSFNDKPNLPYYTGVAVLARIKIDDENFKPADPIQSSGNTGPFFAFPNPSSQSFWLKSAEPGRKPEKIFLFTISGKRKELAFREEEGQFQLINLPDLKSGLYFIEILSKGELFKIRQIILNK